MAFKDDPEERKTYHRNWMKQARKKDPEAFRKRETAWRHKNPVKRLLQCTRQTARDKGLDHTITGEDLAMPVTCPYLGFVIDYSAGNGKTMLNPSVDRIDPSKGYVKGNVEIVSSLANTMKNKATTEQLVLFAKEILRRWS